MCNPIDKLKQESNKNEEVNVLNVLENKFMFLKVSKLFIRFDSIQGFKKEYRNSFDHIYAIVNGVDIDIKDFSISTKCDKSFEFLCEKLVESTQHDTNYGIVDLDEFNRGL